MTSLLDEEDPLVDKELTKKIGDVFFESPEDNIKLQKIIKRHKHPTNLLSFETP